MADWISAIAAGIAAVAALFALWQGIAVYKRDALVNLENSFQRSLPFFANLENDKIYQAEIRPVAQLCLKDQDLTPDQMPTQIQLECAVRFFYLFWVRAGILKDSAKLLKFYSYYLEQLAIRPDVKAYVDHYYPGLLVNLKALEKKS